MRSLHVGVALTLEIEAALQLGDLIVCSRDLVLACEVLLGQRVGDRRDAERVLILCHELRDGPFLRHHALLQRGLQLSESRIRLRELLLILQRLQIDVWIAQRENRLVGCDTDTGAHRQGLHASAGRGDDDPDVFGNERSRRVHRDRHVALLHRVDPERGALDGRRCRLEPTDECGDDEHANDSNAAGDVLLRLFGWLALDIQRSPLVLGSEWCGREANGT
ncbi:MAG: hypothetical protein JF602_02135 [Gemmatimonadetes bacterium]|nr:hypothetical protein [Gemmatimonadota bacterium]